MSRRKQRYPQSPDEQQKSFLRTLHPKNPAQEQYMNALLESKISFCIGPAGTGKTYIASNIALQKLYDGHVERILVTRPIVATEDIGYLPGTLEEKIHPYLLPLLDAFEDHIGVTKTKEMLEHGLIEASPLAFMRGRSINNAFIILDEAQNVTREQMKMFLTRIGYNTIMAINGDATQTDLPNKGDCGLSWAVERLSGVTKDISVIEFMRTDIVRNPLIETMLRHLESPNANFIKPDVTDLVSRRRNNGHSHVTTATPALFRSSEAR
jgi:phosphate starvation-inducible protein PhoH and related proteins